MNLIGERTLNSGNTVVFELYYTNITGTDPMFYYTNEDEYIKVSGHPDEDYNGYYYVGDSWNGYPHWEKSYPEAHIYFFSESYGIGSGYWQLDESE